MDVFDATQRYRGDGRPLIVLAGQDYGSGSSRDWAAKGPWMLVGGALQIGGGCIGGYEDAVGKFNERVGNFQGDKF